MTDYGLKKVENAGSWIAHHGLAVIHIREDSGAMVPHHPITAPHVHPGLPGGAIGFGPVRPTANVSNKILLVSPAGEPIILLPRAASGLSQVSTSLRAGGEMGGRHVNAVADSQLGLWILPTTAARSANERDGSRWVSWQTRRGEVVIEYIPGTRRHYPVERVSLPQLSLTWNFKLNASGTKLV